MAISKVLFDGKTLIDLTNDTVVANKLVAPLTAHNSDGNIITGTVPTLTLPEPTLSETPVIDHSITITPNESITTGYIEADSKTGTSRTVTASELVSGKLLLYDWPTEYDVTNYEKAQIAVPAGFYYLECTQASDLVEGGWYMIVPEGTNVAISATAAGNAYEIFNPNFLALNVPDFLYDFLELTNPGSNRYLFLHTVLSKGDYFLNPITGQYINLNQTSIVHTNDCENNLTRNSNGTYTFEFTTTLIFYTVTYTLGYNSNNNTFVRQNGSNTQMRLYRFVYYDGKGGIQNPVEGRPVINADYYCYPGYGSVRGTTYLATGVKATVTKAGTYLISWIGTRNYNANTFGSLIYINGTAYGTASTTFTNTYFLSNIVDGVALNAGDEVEIRARSNGNTYYMMVGNLIIGPNL